MLSQITTLMLDQLRVNYSHHQHHHQHHHLLVVSGVKIFFLGEAFLHLIVIMESKIKLAETLKLTFTKYNYTQQVYGTV